MSSNLSYDNSNVKVLMEYLTSLFGENVDSFLKDSASYVFGNNQDKKMRIWVGGSGKSTLSKLFLKTFEKDSCVLSSYILQEEKNLEEDNEKDFTELFNNKDKFFGFINECDEFNPSKIKKLLSRDAFYQREMYEEKSVFYTKLIPILITNIEPKIEDVALSYRIKVINFGNNFIQDRNIGDKILNLHEEFRWLLEQNIE
uniref:Uncharacterized protein n=1 Tax=viral metagenome TaxID=1070528 RepID=A0A6C0AE56_9ZZZZ